MWATILEIINKLLDLLKSFFCKDSKSGDKNSEASETSSDETKTSKKCNILVLKYVLNANDRRNLTECAKFCGLTLAKNTFGELTITKKQIDILSQNAKEGKIKGTKRLEIIKSLSSLVA